jgi:hypothetical protein
MITLNRNPESITFLSPTRIAFPTRQDQELIIYDLSSTSPFVTLVATHDVLSRPRTAVAIRGTTTVVIGDQDKDLFTMDSVAGTISSKTDLGKNPSIGILMENGVALNAAIFAGDNYFMVDHTQDPPVSLATFINILDYDVIGAANFVGSDNFVVAEEDGANIELFLWSGATITFTKTFVPTGGVVEIKSLSVVQSSELIVILADDGALDFQI